MKMSNGTLTLRKVMAIDPNLEQLGMGIYKYEEKSFNPTI